MGPSVVIRNETMPTGCVALLVTLGIGPLLDDPALDPTRTEGLEAPAGVPDEAPPDEPPPDEPPPDEPDEPPPDEPDAPFVQTLDEAFADAAPVEIPLHPQWVHHRVLPRERVTQIAVRYGVTPEDLWRWNKRLDPQASYPRGIRHLRVRAHRLPPPRHKVRYAVQAGETWMDVAAKFRVETRDLHAYNWTTRELTAGKELVLWVDPGWPYALRPGQGPPVPERFDVPAGGLSVGRPHRGRLENGVPLPASDLYTRKRGLYGSSHTILQLQRAFADFRHDSGFEGQVIIGAMSRRWGGRFSPHVSHQSGRDIDIRMPVWTSVPASVTSPHPDEIDWYATWALMKAFIATGEVAAIFLDVSRHRFLYEAARAMGETPASMEPVIKWPNWTGESEPVVHHADGHDVHIHVRIKCGPDEPRCKRR
jgi:Penicillin-insensitive murein endopeptidase/LysM domain